jgi:hypothetical protein
MSAGRGALIRQDWGWPAAVWMAVIASRSQNLSFGIIMGPQVNL